MAARTDVSRATKAAERRTSSPRNGGAVSNTSSAHRGSRARCRSLTSPEATTPSNAPSWKRNHTDERAALASFL